MPVPGVKLTVADTGGGEIGVATTDAEGHYELPLPGPGDYRVTIDQSTLPEGVDLRDEAQAEVTVNIRPNERQVLNYFLGESATPDRVPVGPAPPDDRQRHQVRVDHRHHGDRPVADLRHHRAVQLLPRRARHARRGRDVVDEPERRPAPADRHPVRHRRGRARRLRVRSRPVATTAAKRCLADVDDDRVDRARADRPLRVPVHVRRSVQGLPPVRRAGGRLDRPDRHHQARADHRRRLRDRARRRGAVPPEEPPRQGHPGRLRQP